MNEVLTNWWTGLLVMVAIALLAVSFIMQVHEWGIRPLRDVSKVLHRPWFEVVLLIFLAGGLVQHGSTKGTNGVDRGALMGLMRSPAPAVAPTAVDSTGFSIPTNFPTITNLCFWGIEHGDDAVALGIAWPPEMSFTNDCIDIFGSYSLASNGWWRLAQLDVSQIGSNAIIELAYSDLPTNAMHTSAFYRLASQDDSDGNGLTDKVEEWVLETDPILPDSDNDGLPDGDEIEIETDPKLVDSDGDGMSDGWETANGLDPQSATGDDGASGDVDLDGLCNFDEFQLGCDPNDVDSDGDGVSDCQEICNGSNPADGFDKGIPSADFPNRGLTFNVYGDYAAWRMTIAGRGPVDVQTDTVTMSSPGVGNDKLKILKKGNSYRLTMKWLNSDGHTNPNWYCWQAKVNGLPTTASYQSYTSTRLSGNEMVYGLGWMAENSDGLLTDHVHTYEGAGGNVAEGLESLLHIYKCEIAICDPIDESWPEIEKSRVLLDNESLRIRVKISPSIPTLELCMLIMGSNVVVSTSGTCPAGIELPIVASEFFTCGTHSEIKLTRTRAQMIALGLLPSSNEDGTDEMSSYDVGTLGGNAGSDLSDCFAFEQINLACRGRASNERTLTLDSNPPNAELSESFFKAAGAEVLSVTYAGVRSSCRQIMNQADYFYYSGHGNHRWGMVDDFEPSAVSDYWQRDLNCAIFAGCSVLDINDYNNNFLNSDGVWDPENHSASPGKLWEAKGPNVLLGYNYYAPQDETGAPERIIRSWLNLRLTMGDAEAWMKANDNMNGRNACVIVKGEKYIYFKKSRHKFYSTYEKKEISKEHWND